MTVPPKQSNFDNTDDLALHIQKEIDKHDKKKIPTETLERFFEVLLFVSMETEEGKHIQVTITFYNPNEVEKLFSDSKKTVHEKWEYIPFLEPIPFDVSGLVKLSNAADPWSGSLAVYYNSNGKLLIYGMIDQAIHLESYIHLEETTKASPPGLFQASITGIGIISVRSSAGKAATLKRGKLIKSYLNIFYRGPVADIIKKISLSTDAEVIRDYNEKGISIDGFEGNEHKSTILYRNSLKRLLNRIKIYNHGGALLITSDTKSESLRIKYPIQYDRLKTAIKKYCKNANEKKMIMPDDDDQRVPNTLQADQLIEEQQSITREIKGCIRFIASMAGVDGLVLMNNQAVIKGFGVVIRDVHPPESVYVSSTLDATEKKFKKRNPKEFGTRHQSMFAYCNQHEGSLGFVISQDGDIRVITKVDDKLIVWENIEIQKIGGFKTPPRKNKT
jgi:hypothetical protein